VLGSDAEYVEAFSELFEQVMSEQLRASAPVAVQLSGGLDSGAVAAVAAHQLASRGRPLATYTAVPRAGFIGPVPEGRFADELPLVHALAALHANIDPRPVGSHAGLLERADRFLDAAELPFRNAANRGWTEAIYERAQMDGVGTLLTGDQGNLTVSWDGKGLLPELIRRGRLASALAESRARARSGRARSTWRAMANGVRPLLPEAMNGAIEWLRGNPQARSSHPWETDTLLNPEFALEHRVSERINGGRTRHLGLVGTDSRAVRLGILLSTGSLAAEIYSAYRALFRIDTRTPLADRRLVELCLAMPEEQFTRRGETRWLIRRAMAERLPAPTLHGRQRGLQAADWFDLMSEERSELVSEVVRLEENDLARKVLDLPRLRRLVEEWPIKGPTDPRAVALYRGGIGMALMTGRFLLWAQTEQNH
jgi:asparagine synthase (glutamine-hydrolysing)